MYRSVENEAPAESVHSVGMNRSVGDAFLRNARVWEHHFLPSDANLRLAKRLVKRLVKLGYYMATKVVNKVCFTTVLRHFTDILKIFLIVYCLHVNYSSDTNYAIKIGEFYINLF
jgi:hypothetical protein